MHKGRNPKTDGFRIAAQFASQRSAMKRRFLKTSALRNLGKLRERAQQDDRRGERAKRALAILDRQLAILIEGDPFHVARVAFGLMRPRVMEFQQPSISKFAEFAVEVAKFDRAVRNSLSSDAQLIAKLTIQQQHEFADGLPQLPQPKRMVGNTPGQLAIMARHIIELLLEIRKRQSEGPEGAEFLVMFMRGKGFLPLTKNSFGRPRTETFNTWFDCAWELLKVLASQPTTSTVLEDRERLHQLSVQSRAAHEQSESEDVKTQIRAKKSFARIQKDLLRLEPEPNEYGRFLDHSAYYENVVRKMQRKCDDNLAGVERALRAKGVVVAEINMIMAGHRTEIDRHMKECGEPKARKQADADLKKNFKKTCEREWARLIDRRQQAE